MSHSLKANFGLLVAGALTFILMGAGLALYGPALPAYARQLGLELPQASWIISAHWIGCAMGVGGLYWLNRPFSLQATLLIILAGTGLLALGNGVVTTFAGALIFGMGYGLGSAVLNPRLLATFGPRGPAMLSLMNACFGIGAILAPLAFIWLGARPELAFLLLAATTLLNWLIAVTTDRTAPPTNALTQEPAPFHPRYRLQIFAILAIGIEALLGGLGPSALIAAGQSETAASHLQSLFFVAFLAARVGLIFIAHLVAPFTVYIAALAACLLFSIGSAIISPALFFIALGIPAGLFFPSFYVAASRAMGESPRTSPIIIGAGLIGGIIAPILLAPVMAALGAAGFFWVIALIAALGLAGAGIARTRLPVLRE